MTVVNPPPGGGKSNLVLFSITRPAANVGFRLGSSPAVGNSPFSVAQGDFNGDGKLDLVVADHAADNLSVLLGDGKGNFTLQSSPTTGSKPYSAAVGDFNGDGRLDLATANNADDTVTVLVGDGTGNLPRPPPPPSAPNRRPLPSVITTRTADWISPLRTMAATVYRFSWATAQAILSRHISVHLRQPHSVAVGDLNGDGKLEVAVACFNGGGIGILLGNGGGNFAWTSTLPLNSPYSVTVADFNGDAELDVAATNGAQNSVFLGDGAGNFTLASTSTPGGYVITAADFNGDGKLDLAAVETGGKRIRRSSFSWATVRATLLWRLVPAGRVVPGRR